MEIRVGESIDPNDFEQLGLDALSDQDVGRVAVSMRICQLTSDSETGRVGQTKLNEIYLEGCRFGTALGFIGLISSSFEDHAKVEVVKRSLKPAEHGFDYSVTMSMSNGLLLRLLMTKIKTPEISDFCQLAASTGKLPFDLTALAEDMKQSEQLVAA